MRLDRPLVLTLLATLATVALFAAAPGLDLAAAALFHDGSRFIGRTRAGEAARMVFYVLPFLVLAGAVALWLAGRMGRARPRVSGAAALWLVLTMAAGPGLLVNLILKEHSHRPRPGHVAEFGGVATFRPIGRFDGACAKNCSFVSGEAAAAAWTLAPALLTPPPVRAGWVAASMILAGATGLLRMSFGGHFLSDVVLGVLFTVLIVLASRPFFLRASPPSL
jgi:lipid A 4'-phosphatase